MTEQEMAGMLGELLQDEDHLQESGFGVMTEQVSSFDEAGIMTMNKGLMVELVDEEGERCEFQITVVRSK